MLRFLRSAMTAFTSPPRVPIPANGVDYRGKVVLAPMVRSGELPSRLLALKYGADLVWGPETIDRALIGADRRINLAMEMLNLLAFPRTVAGQRNPHKNPSSIVSIRSVRRES